MALLVPVFMNFSIKEDDIFSSEEIFEKGEVEEMITLKKQIEVIPTENNTVTDTGKINVSQGNKYLTAELLDSPIIPELGGTTRIKVRTNLKSWNTEVALGSGFTAVSQRRSSSTDKTVEFIVTVTVSPFQPISNITKTRSSIIQINGKDIDSLRFNINQTFEKKYLTAAAHDKILWIGGSVVIKVKTNLDAWSIDPKSIQPKQSEHILSFSPISGGRGETNVIMTSTLTIPMTFRNIKFKGMYGNYEISHAIIIEQDFLND